MDEESNKKLFDKNKRLLENLKETLQEDIKKIELHLVELRQKYNIYENGSGI